MARIPAREWHAANSRRYGNPAGDVRRAADTEVAAALGFDHASLPDAWYALLPFVTIETDDGPVIAATDQPELPFTTWNRGGLWVQLADGSIHDSETLLDLDRLDLAFEEKITFPNPALIPHDPTTGPSDTAQILTLAPDGRAGILRERRRNLLHIPQRDPDEHIRLYTDGRQFFRAWVGARIRHRQAVRAARRDYLIEMPERSDGCIPGALLIGDARKVAWPQDRHFICSDDETARDVSAGIYRSARLSRVTVAAPAVRKAA